MAGRQRLRPALIALGLLGASAIHAHDAAPAPDSAPAPVVLAPGEGRDIVQARCTVCHAANMITARFRTSQQWADVVDQMVNKGAQVSDEDYPVIIAYLTRSYGVAP
jgi:cytochrome c5